MKITPLPDMPTFSVDSKRHYKEWFKDGERKEFHGLLAVVVSPSSSTRFEQDYSELMKKLFAKHNFPMKRPVYKSTDIAKMCGMDLDRFRNFLLEFSRTVLSWDYVGVHYVYTRLNPKYLDGGSGKVIVYGDYGTTTRKVSIPHFLGIIQNYYNAIAAWIVASEYRVKGARFVFDGTEGVLPCAAWEDLRQRNQVEIIFGGDRTDPTIAAADLILRTLDFFLKQSYGYLNEETLKKIIFYDDKVKRKMDETFNIHYVGNPHLKAIVPRNDRSLGLPELFTYVRRPVVFASAGGLAGQKDLLEASPVFDDLMSRVSGLHASYMMFDPKQDRALVGSSEKQADYFFPLTPSAREYLELLKTTRRNVEELKL